MDYLLSLQGIAASTIGVASAVVLIVVILLPKQRRSAIRRKVGAWFLGF
jgi:hypothetical protein